MYDDNIFKDKNARKEILLHENFIDFLFKLYPNFRAANKGLLSISWDTYQERLVNEIQKALQDFDDEAKSVKIDIPATGIKGIYFCLGDDGRSLCIAGSLYFNESDWAAYADFYVGDTGNNDNIILSIIDDLEKSKSSKNEIEDIIYVFVVFSIIKLLRNSYKIPQLINTGIALGYSDGDELIMGEFKQSKFVPKIKVVKDGNYKNPSTAPKIEILREKTEPLWLYLRHNYTEFIRKHNLYMKLDIGGEKEAERIVKEYTNDLFINRCRKCNFIKMTPTARQCLNCMDFCDPALTKFYIMSGIKKLFKKFFVWKKD